MQCIDSPRKRHRADALVYLTDTGKRQDRDYSLLAYILFYQRRPAAGMLPYMHASSHASFTYASKI